MSETGQEAEGMARASGELAGRAIKRIDEARRRDDVRGGAHSVGVTTFNGRVVLSVETPEGSCRVSLTGTEASVVAAGLMRSAAKAGA